MTQINTYQPPFPWFGGKYPVADRVWAAIGDVSNYVEPFCGTCAVLLLRPGGAGRFETVNDADGLLANFWRAMKHDPDTVAKYADEQVNECELHAKHLWLIGEKPRIAELLMGDADFFDAKAAGWWVWGQCCWIGSGWCSGKGPWQSVDGKMVLGNRGQGVYRKRPHLSRSQGVNRQLPHLGRNQGVNRQFPHLGDRGKVPTGNGECARRLAWLRSYLQEFTDRLRSVRVCCGDWSRVCGQSVTFLNGTTGVFLDPPYADTANRTKGLYANDCEQVAHAAREWAIDQGHNPLMRIVLADYGESEMPSEWTRHNWEAMGGYGLAGNGLGRENRKRETLWMSPHCLESSNTDGLFSSPASAPVRVDRAQTS